MAARKSKRSTKTPSFKESFGESSVKLGNVNAAFPAKLLDAKGEVVGFCMAVPNSVACAMANDARIVAARSKWSTFSRKELEDHFDFTRDDAEMRSTVKMVA